MTTITVLSSNGVKLALGDLLPRFERASGHAVEATFDPAAALKARMDRGEACDLAILTDRLVDRAIGDGQIVAGSRVDIARSGCGLAVKKGMPVPDIATVDAFKRALLDARAVAYTTQGASGQYFAMLIERLGIAEAINAKARTQPGGFTGERLLSGEVDIAVQQIPELGVVPGIDIVPFPPEVQEYTMFSSGLPTRSSQPDAARALVAFLKSADASAVFKSKGMEPA